METRQAMKKIIFGISGGISFLLFLILLFIGEHLAKAQSSQQHKYCRDPHSYSPLLINYKETSSVFDILVNAGFQPVYALKLLLRPPEFQKPDRYGLFVCITVIIE